MQTSGRAKSWQKMIGSEEMEFIPETLWRPDPYEAPPCGFSGTPATRIFPLPSGSARLLRVYMFVSATGIGSEIPVASINRQNGGVGQLSGTLSTTGITRGVVYSN